MGRVIFITSFKGGVGKTTLSANLSSVLAGMGHKILTVDGDFGMRCLDMALGLESDVIYDINDVINGKCRVEDAVIPCGKTQNLFFLASPMWKPENILPAGRFMDLFKYLRTQFDYIIIDSSAEESPYYLSLASAADDALVVSLHQSMSIRAAEKTGIKLRALGFRNLRLIVNCYRNDFAKGEALPAVYDLINLSAIKLLGVIPYDQNVVLDQEKGVTAFGTADRHASPYEAAVYNIACRIKGKNVPLFKNVSKPKKKHRYPLAF
ncbi:MAG: AAA family ATPase [Eubacteriales bacterium]|nr:AAA family ATPase [Eubacteriales bacterium]